MKPQRLVPIFILALTLPGYLLAGSGASHRRDCGCAQARKVTQKSSGCGCGARQKIAQKSPASKCGCGFLHTGKGHRSLQKGLGIIRKINGGLQKGSSLQKPDSSQKDSSTQKQSSTRKHSAGKSKSGCSKCCLRVIPAFVVNGLEHVLSGTLHHLSSAFACTNCGGKGKSKAGLPSFGSKSKGCGCSGSSKVPPRKVPPNPFQDDEVQNPVTPSAEASNRIERRPVHRPVFRTRATTLTVGTAPRILSFSSATPLAESEPKSSTVFRTISAVGRASLLPDNPLRVK